MVKGLAVTLLFNYVASKNMTGDPDPLIVTKKLCLFLTIAELWSLTNLEIEKKLY